MLERNKKEEVFGWADSKMRKLYNEWREAMNALWRETKRTYLKAEAIKVYDPTRPDGEAAKIDLDKAKYRLLCSIGHYDNAVAAVKRHYMEHHEEMNVNWNTDFCTSHEQIEFAIHDILKGKF